MLQRSVLDKIKLSWRSWLVMTCSCSPVGIARHRPRYRTGPQRYNLSHSSTVWAHPSHSDTVSHVSQEITGKTQQPSFCGERAHCAVMARRNPFPSVPCLSALRPGAAGPAMADRKDEKQSHCACAAHRSRLTLYAVARQKRVLATFIFWSVPFWRYVHDTLPQDFGSVNRA